MRTEENNGTKKTEAEVPAADLSPVRIEPGADAKDRPQALVPGLPERVAGIMTDHGEGHGTTYREAMKRSMAEPAGFKPLNKRQETEEEGIKEFIGYLLVLWAALAGCVGFWYAVNWLEHFGRAH